MPGETYTVQKGDTLSGIARRNGTTTSKLAALNGISNPDRIQAGQTLVVPGPPAAPPAAKPAAQAGEAAAETKPDTRPGEICETCKAADEDKDDKPGMVRAGGDANVDVIYSEGTGSTQSVGALGTAEGKVGAGMARMDHSGNFGASPVGGSHQLEVMNAEAKGHAGIAHGVGAKGTAGTRMVKQGGSVFVGEANNPYAEAGGEYELMSAEAKGDVLLGSDGKRAGIGIGGAAGAAAAKGDLQGEINIPIPFTDKTFTIRAKGGGSAGSIRAGARAYAYKNLETGRHHLGSGGEAALLLGGKVDLDLSIGPKYTSRDRPDGQ